MIDFLIFALMGIIESGGNLGSQTNQQQQQQQQQQQFLLQPPPIGMNPAPKLQGFPQPTFNTNLQSGGQVFPGVPGRQGVYSVPIVQQSPGVISTGQPGGAPVVVQQAIQPGGQLVSVGAPGPMQVQFYVPPINTNVFAGGSPIVPAPISQVNPNTLLPNTPPSAVAPPARYLV